MSNYSLRCGLQPRTNVNNLEENECLDLWLSSPLSLFLPNPMDSTPIFTIWLLIEGGCEAPSLLKEDVKLQSTCVQLPHVGDSRFFYGIPSLSFQKYLMN
ncbi:uncharacterized protein DS421_10g294490 [Arachis hypogaea]|nr:uncharacterized protein DS421_10g294490 [Arachis hypogaea]